VESPGVVSCLPPRRFLPTSPRREWAESDGVDSVLNGR
jgi:hypothetical protein